MRTVTHLTGACSRPCFAGRLKLIVDAALRAASTGRELSELGVSRAERGPTPRSSGHRSLRSRLAPAWGFQAGQPSFQPTRGCRSTRALIHLAVDAHGLPVRVLITPGTTTDCTQASKLIEGMAADHLIADRGYDTDAVLQQAARQGMNAVVLPKKNRTVQRTYDKDIYKLRHLVENAFLALKQWRGIAT